MIVLEKQIGEVGDLIEVKPRASLFYFDMVYEGMIDGWHAFANYIMYSQPEKIVSWRAKPDEIQIIKEEKPKKLSLATKTLTHYSGEDFERAKKLLVAGGLMK